jgi:hypothetical protein
LTALIRPMLAVDRQFVLSGWSSSYRTSDRAGMIPMDEYAEVMHRWIGRILDHPSTVTLVAEQPGETVEDGKPFLYGFVCFSPPSYVYYLFVKTSYRRARSRYNLASGYATQLLAATGIDPRSPFEYACHTATVSDLARKIPLAEHNPLPARFLHEHRSSTSPEEVRRHTRRRTAPEVHALRGQRTPLR